MHLEHSNQGTLVVSIKRAIKDIYLYKTILKVKRSFLWEKVFGTSFLFCHLKHDLPSEYVSMSKTKIKGKEELINYQEENVRFCDKN